MVWSLRGIASNVTLSLEWRVNVSAVQCVEIIQYWAKYKPAAQAASADPFPGNSTNRQNPPIQDNRYNFWTSNAIMMPFKT